MADESIISSGKSRWPELVFVDGRVATLIIKRENPEVETVVELLAGSPVTKDLRPERVRLFVNLNGRVVEVPRVG